MTNATVLNERPSKKGWRTYLSNKGDVPQTLMKGLPVKDGVSGRDNSVRLRRHTIKIGRASTFFCMVFRIEGSDVPVPNSLITLLRRRVSG